MAANERRNKRQAEALRRLLDEQGWSQSWVAGKLDVSRQTVNLLVNGWQAISHAQSKMLGKLTGQPSWYWALISFLDEAEAEAPETALPLSTQDLDSLARDAGGLRAPRPEDPNPNADLPYGLCVDWVIRLARERALWECEPFRPERVEPASYDLAVRKVETDMGWEELPEDGYSLPAGKSLYVQTEEEIRLQRNMVGWVGGGTKLMRERISVHQGSQIDPGFTGPLRLWIRNEHDSKPFLIERGSGLFSLQLAHLPVEAEQGVTPRPHWKKSEKQLPSSIVSVNREEVVVVKEIPIKWSNGGTEVGLLSPLTSFHERADEPEAALDKLCRRLATTFLRWARSESLAGKAEREFKDLRTYLEMRDTLPALDVAKAFAREGWIIDTVGDEIHIEELSDGAVVNGISLQAQEQVPVRTIAQRLDMSEEEVWSVLGGTASTPA